MFETLFIIPNMCVADMCASPIVVPSKIPLTILVCFVTYPDIKQIVSILKKINNGAQKRRGMKGLSLLDVRVVSRL